MRVLWSQRASKSLHSLEDYILQEFGELKRQEYMEKAESVARRLETYPNMGKEEPALMHRKKRYKSVLITPRTKCIYYVDGECIVIADVWDTRREPKTVAANL